MGLEDGAALNGGRLLVDIILVVVFAVAVAALDKPDPVEPPVVWASSSSRITMGCSVSAIGRRGTLDGLALGRGRNMGEALKILPTTFFGI